MGWLKAIVFLIPALRDLLKENKATLCLLIGLGFAGWFARADMLERHVTSTKKIDGHTKSIHNIEKQNVKVIESLKAINKSMGRMWKTMDKVDKRVWKIYTKLPK